MSPKPIDDQPAYGTIAGGDGQSTCLGTSIRPIQFNNWRFNKTGLRGAINDHRVGDNRQCRCWLNGMRAWTRDVEGNGVWSSQRIGFLNGRP